MICPDGKDFADVHECEQTSKMSANSCRSARNFAIDDLVAEHGGVRLIVDGSLLQIEVADHIANILASRQLMNFNKYWAYVPSSI